MGDARISQKQHIAGLQALVVIAEIDARAVSKRRDVLRRAGGHAFHAEITADQGQRFACLHDKEFVVPSARRR